LAEIVQPVPFPAVVRLAVSSRTARGPIVSALSKIPGIELVEAASTMLLVDEVPKADGLILSDPRGPDGAALATALARTEARVRWIQVVSAGYSGLLSHHLPASLVVTNQGGVVARAVAEHALALILALMRRLPEALVAQSQSKWKSTAIRGVVRSIEGATVVIVGLGHVGRTLAQLLAPLGARRIGVNRTGAIFKDVEQTVGVGALKEVAAVADVVVLCLPDSPQTRNLVDEQLISMMRRKAFLVNVGRGATVDIAALTRALVEGRLAGAALDVTDPEPLPSQHPLWGAPNLILTPHVAGGGSPLTGERIARMVADNAARFVRGDSLLNQVHPRTDT
jgi:phosphoglycerate dehydrogenase-like enzyme